MRHYIISLEIELYKLNKKGKKKKNICMDEAVYKINIIREQNLHFMVILSLNPA